MGRGDQGKTFFLKAVVLCDLSFMVKSWVVVVAPGIILSSPGTEGTLYFPFPMSQVPSPVLPDSNSRFHKERQHYDRVKTRDGL